MLSRGQSPYEGDVFNQVPLVLSLYQVLSVLPPACTPLFFILLDVLVAAGIFLLAKTVRSWVVNEEREDLLSPEAIALLFVNHFPSCPACLADIPPPPPPSMIDTSGIPFPL